MGGAIDLMNNVKNFFIRTLENAGSNMRFFKDDPDANEMKENLNREMMYFIFRDRKEEQTQISNFSGISLNEKTFEIIGISDKYRDIDKLNEALSTTIQNILKSISFMPNIKEGTTKIINAHSFKASFEGVAENKSDMVYSLSFKVTWE